MDGAFFDLEVLFCESTAGIRRNIWLATSSQPDQDFVFSFGRKFCGSRKS